METERALLMSSKGDNFFLLPDLVAGLKKCGKRPVGDANELLAPLCETIEAVLRNGLKREFEGVRKNACQRGV